jgi:hypothetical protein
MRAPTRESFHTLGRPAPLPPQRRTLMAQCSFCGHHWPLLFLPMELHEMGHKVRNAHCPRCEKGREYILVGEDTQR